jgi:hypothetical protein
VKTPEGLRIYLNSALSPDVGQGIEPAPPEEEGVSDPVIRAFDRIESMCDDGIHVATNPCCARPG